jgi:hypothetical protein
MSGFGHHSREDVGVAARRTGTWQPLRAGTALVAAIAMTSALSACGDNTRGRWSFSPSDEDPDKPLREQLGCGSALHYVDHLADYGLVSGIGSFCADSPDIREVLRAHQKYGFPCDSRDVCRFRPVGEIFVFWRSDVRPNPGCTSGCTPGIDPEPL